MKFCPQCGQLYDASEVYCDEDGAVLQERSPEDRVGDATPIQSRQKHPAWLGGVVGVGLGAVTCAAVFLAYLYFTRGPAQPQPSEVPRPRDVADAKRPLRLPDEDMVSPLPTPSETPSPEPTKTPAPASREPPTPTPTPGFASVETLRTTPGATGEETRSRIILHLSDGRVIEADDAWRAADVVWYRRGGLTESVDTERVQAVERRSPPKTSP